MASQNPKSWGSGHFHPIVAAGFALVGILILLDELLDLPHLLFRSPTTPLNWTEFVVEFGVVSLIGFLCLHLLGLLESKRRGAEEALAAEKKRLAVTLRSIADGVIATEVEGRIVLINEAAESLTGWSQKEAIEKPLSEVFHIVNEKTRKRCENPVERVLETGGTIGLANDTVLVARDGTETIIADSGAPIRDEKDNVIGVIVVFRDITEGKRAEQELEKHRHHLERLVEERTAQLRASNEQLQEEIKQRKQAEEALQKAHNELETRVQRRTAELLRANGEMQSFIYSISHDLRMPLVAVQGFANLLREEYGDKLKGEATKYLSAIVESTRKMSALIEDLLQLSRVGRMDTELEEIAPKSLVEDIATELKVKTQNRKLNFRIKGPLPKAYCNRKRLYQVFSNLMDNAVKFTQDTPETTIEVGVRKAKDKEEFYVRDNGPGIEPEYQQEIFKVFRRLHGSGYEGSGMGLTFAKKIVESWGGNIRVDSQPGKGTTFYFTVPKASKSNRTNSKRITTDSRGVLDRIQDQNQKT